MDRERLFEILDIDDPADFTYYENFDALMEEEEHIEEDLISEIIAKADTDLLREHIDSFFDSFLSNIPDEETELAILIDIFRSNMSSVISDSMDDEDIAKITKEIYNFRSWYVMEHNATDLLSGEEISVRDARYEIMASKFLDQDASVDFGRALASGPDSYEVKLKDIIQ